MASCCTSTSCRVGVRAPLAARSATSVRGTPLAATPARVATGMRRVQLASRAMAEDAEGVLKTEIAFAPQRDAEGVLKTWPTQMNLESRNQTLEVSGSAQKILVYAPGTVADQLLLFPMLQHIKNSLPNAPIDVMCNQWAKAAYDICPFVNNTHVYDTEGVNSGADYTEALGVIKNEYYTAMIGAKPLGINGASLLWMASSTNVIGYEKTDGNPGNLVAKMMMKSSVPAPCENPLDLGSSAFDLLAGCVTNALNIPAMSDKSSKVGIPEYPASFAEHALADLGLKKGEYILAHGVPTTSKKAMVMSAHAGSSSLDFPFWEALAKEAKKPLVIAVPREEEAAAVAAAAPSAKVLVVPAPGKLLAMIANSAGVVAANTAALPLASYVNVPALGMFESDEVAAKYAYAGVTCVQASDAAAKVASR